MFLDLQPLESLIHMRFFAARWREYYAAIRQANNSPVQGGSADLVAEAMVKAGEMGKSTVSFGSTNANIWRF